MAKKSSKTAHVLSLITDNSSKQETKDASEIAELSEDVDNHEQTEPPVNLSQNKEYKDNKDNQTKSASPVLEINSSSSNPVSEIIHEKLLEEIGEQAFLIVPAQISDGESFSTPVIQKGDYVEDVSPISDTPSKKQPVVTSFEMVDFDNPEKAIDPLSEHPDLDFCYINILEKLVKEKAHESMTSFEVCMCNRCIADVIALSLSNLPSKYVVTDKENLIPMMNYYSNKYNLSITAELTKACITVNTNPHHNRK